MRATTTRFYPNLHSMASPEQPNTIYIVDGSGYIFRAFYGVAPLSTRAGLPTNAVVGFARMLSGLLREHRPKFLAMAFDARGTPTFRHEIYDQYKANRDATPEDLLPQFELIERLVQAMQIPIIRKPGYEADDLIGALSARAVEAGFRVVVVSGDKDLMQLVSDDVEVFEPMKSRRFDAVEVTKKFGVGPNFVADALALAGDSSDNIPGVPKVGPKKAAELITRYGDVEAIINGLQGAQKPKAFERSVLENSDLARLSKRLTVLDCDAPVALPVSDYGVRTPDREALAELLQEIEARKLYADLLGSSATAEADKPGSQVLFAGGEVPGDVPKEQDSIIDRSAYRSITTLKDLDAVIVEITAAGRFCVDLETTSLRADEAVIVGIALRAPDSPAVYIPLRHSYLGVPSQLDPDLVLERLLPLLENPAIGKVGQNLKYDIGVFKTAGVEMCGVADDSMLAAYVLNSDRTSYSLDTLAAQELGHETVAYSDVVGKGKKQTCFSAVEVDRATTYAAEDADVAWELCERFPGQVNDEGLGELYRKLELPLVPVLARMEAAGIEVDRNRLRELATEFGERIATLEDRAYELIGHQINLGSPKQLAEVFFNQLGYPVVKKTKTGFSTDHEVLETLARDYELPGVVLKRRLLSKLKSTYVDSLLTLCSPRDGRVHTSFNQCGTATGRLSSSSPNLQNIPIRGTDGRRIREAFVAPKGSLLVKADYSQVELRVLAHLCGDESFVEAFVRGEDIHARTAAELFNEPPLGDPSDQASARAHAEARRQAKAVNFGVIYGLGAFGLARQLDISMAEAKSFIERYFARYPRVRSFLDETIERARDDGFVTTLLGRRRFLPGLRSRNHNQRKAAERVAMNTPIQGSAADLIKLAMLAVDRRLLDEDANAKLLLQVHDELVIETPESGAEAIKELLKTEMEGVAELSVPLEVTVSSGPAWD